MKLETKAMGPFVIQKVASQWVAIEDWDGLGGHSRQVQAYTIHASHFPPFDEPYVEP